MAFGAFSAAPPAGAVSNANTTYEEDCTTSLQPGVAAPFEFISNVNTTTDTAAPNGVHFGISGALSVFLAGPFLAEFADNSVLTPAGVGLTLSGVTFGSTDGTATGSYSLTSTIPQSASYYSSSALTGVSFSSGDTTISYTGGTVAVGDGIAGTGLSSQEVVSVVPNTSITLSAPTSANSAGSYTSYTGAVLTTSPFASSATAFATNGVNGGTANVGITGVSGIGVNIALTVQFGAVSGGNGVGAANCLETGWDASENPSFPQTNESTPGFPPQALGGPVQPLVAATGGFITQPGVTAGDGITPPTAAYVSLVSAPPTANSQTVNLGEGGSANITLSANAGSFPVASYSLVGGSPQTLGGRLTVTLTDPSTGAVSLSDTGATAVVLTFQFNACDGESPPVCTPSPGTVTVDIGTPPVIQPFTENVSAGQLVLSCDSPANYITPAGQNQSPAPTGSNPLLQCPEFQFPPITLDGLEQTVTGTTGETGGNPSGSNPGTIYISDNRGSPTDSWTLTGTFIPTAIGGGNGQNPNASCAGVDAFCNSSVGAAALNTATNGAHDGQIAPNYLQVGGIGCTADATGGTGTPAYNPPNLNPDATPTAGGNFGSPVTLCSASVGQSGGTFLYNATYTLTIPESVYAGNYYGTVQYTVG